MDSGPPNLPLLLLACLLHFWQCARGQSFFTIDGVGLTILPGSTVQSGTAVTLRCEVRVSHDNLPHLQHKFQLRRDDVLIYSFTTEEDSITYELDPARAVDSGSYECRVAVKGKSKASFSKRLDVTGLQTPILYLDKASPYENEEFTAACSAPQEKGSLVFRFYQRFRTGAPESIKRTAATGNSSETTLILRTIGDSVLYCDYEVNLVSGRSNRSNEITVIVKGLYISPTMNVLPSLDVFECDVLEVVCTVKNSLKNIDVFLTRDRRILKQAPVSLSHRFTAQEGDSGELVCKAEWGNVQKETYRTITVKELFSKPRLTVTPTDMFEGDRFEVTCSVSIYVPERISNESMRFSIYKDNVKLASAATYSTVAEPSTNGKYTCKATAASLSFCAVEKESQAVAVEAKVPVSKPMLSVVGGTLVLGKRFQLLCHSASGTLPITYTLRSPAGPTQRGVVSNAGEEAIFNSSAIHKTSDLNNFLCHATNGENQPPMTGTGQQLLRSAIIEPVSVPVLMVLPGAGDVSEGQDVTLVCSVVRGTPPVRFTWFHAETEGALFSQTAKDLKGSYSISNVRGEHRGQYYCVGNNPANATMRSLTITIGVKLAGWKKGLIAVVVICILLILALILILALKRRLLLFKRKRTGELSVKSASTKTERLSLTQAEVNEAANVTPGMIGKSVWSEHVSGSESEDQNSVTAPEKPPEPQYAEVQTRPADPSRAPVKKENYSEVRHSKQGVPEEADACFVPAQQGSVEYAQLNHDKDHHGDHGDHGNHGDHSIQDDYIDEIDVDSVHIDVADHGEGKQDGVPAC